MDDICEYISQENGMIADKVIQTIFERIQYLALFPELWPRIWATQYREIIDSVYKYQIRYSIVWEEVRVITIYKFKNT